MYKKVSTNMNFVDRERETLKFWQENKIFEKQLAESADRPTYTFYDGPPTANGKPHIGHVLTRVIKDMIPRYQWMKGRDVPRKAGWDTHGLPVEIEVEKKLGLTVRNRSNSTVWNPLSTNARNPCGSTRVCGKISPVPSVSGRIWTILM